MMNADIATVVDIVVKTLKSFALRSSYQDEQRDLQPHLQEVIDAVLQEQFPGLFSSVLSVGGGSPKPSIRAVGTSFWPDIEIRQEENLILGIEAKYIRRDHSASKPFAETFGQSLLYRLRYPHVIAFVLHEGKDDQRLNEVTNRLHELLRLNDITLVIRKR